MVLVYLDGRPWFDKAMIIRLAWVRAKPKLLAEPGVENLPAGWSKSPVDPGRAAQALKHVQLKSAFALCAYLYRADDNGNGFVYAVPEDSGLPEPNAYTPSPRTAISLNLMNAPA